MILWCNITLTIFSHIFKITSFQVLSPSPDFLTLICRRSQMSTKMTVLMHTVCVCACHICHWLAACCEMSSRVRTSLPRQL